MRKKLLSSISRIILIGVLACTFMLLNLVNPEGAWAQSIDAEQYCDEGQETELNYLRESCTIETFGKKRIYAKITNEGSFEEMLNFRNMSGYCISGGSPGSGLRLGIDSYIALDCDPIGFDYTINLAEPITRSRVSVIWYGID
ncbi:MAG: hypothetical protein F6J99_12915 [Moorea sp. SIO4G3]|nr:hypothetical protein [Moorena sp. SIO4G3]